MDEERQREGTQPPIEAVPPAPEAAAPSPPPFEAAAPSPPPFEAAAPSAPVMDWATPANAAASGSAPAAATAPPVSWQAPPAVATGIPVPGSQGIYFAGIWPRFAAWLIDAVILILIDIVVGIVFSAVARGIATPIGAVADVLISAAYFIPLWRGGGRATLGMRALSIQIGNAFDGLPLTGRQAVLRWAGLGYPLGLLFALPTTAGIGVLLDLLLVLALFLTTLGSTTRQGWHDQLANSAVVRRPGTSGSNTAAIVIVVVLVLIVLVIFAVAGFGYASLHPEILSRLGTSP